MAYKLAVIAAPVVIFGQRASILRKYYFGRLAVFLFRTGNTCGQCGVACCSPPRILLVQPQKHFAWGCFPTARTTSHIWLFENNFPGLVPYQIIFASSRVSGGFNWKHMCLFQGGAENWGRYTTIAGIKRNAFIYTASCQTATGIRSAVACQLMTFYRFINLL